MKKLFIAALMLVGLASFAQEKPGFEKKDKMEKLTPQQRDELHLKKLTLDLDLNESQQKEMGAIIAEQSAKREAIKAERKANKDKAAPTSDEVFAREKKMLDEQIAIKTRVKKFLTPEQYEKWENGRERKMDQFKDRGGKGKPKSGKPDDVEK